MAEVKQSPQEKMNFAFYQRYLAEHKNANVTTFGGRKAEPMSFENFTRVFEALGGNAGLVKRNQELGIPGTYGEFSEGQEELAIRTRGRSVPGMEYMLDPRANYTADEVINNYRNLNPDDPMNLFSDISGGGYDSGEGSETDGPYTTMGGPSTGSATGLSTGSSANIRNPYKPGTQQYEDFKERRSAYDLLFQEFNRYGLGSLVEPLKGLIRENISPSEFTIRLRETEPYKRRFAGNAARVAKGLAAISESEYIQLEDQYQNIMRNYGLPESYWKKDSLGTQEGFTNFIGNDVSAPELEERIMNAQNRVVNANPEVSQALKQFYPEITNGDILAYTLDPTKGIDVIKRKITAAEIGGAAIQSGLQTGLTRAEELRAAGVTKDTAQQGFGTIAGGLQRGSQLASIYGEDPYTQTTAEQEVFGLAGAQEARKQRQKVTGLEKATFGGQTGLTSGALARDRAGGY